MDCCPEENGSQLLVTLNVADKNYSNVSDVGFEPVDENLPLNEYISNYYYIVQNINNGIFVASSLLPVFEQYVKEIQFMINDLPEGEYKLVALSEIAEGALQTIGAVALHRGGGEDSDLYLTIDTISIAAGESKSVSLDLARTKGKLCLIFNNLPDKITRLSSEITNISQHVNAAGYTGATTVSEVFTRISDPLRASGQTEQFETFLAPSVEDETSTLNLSLYSNNSNTPTYIIDPIEISVNRNEITPVTLNYDEVSNSFEILVYIDDEWVSIELDI